MGSVKGDDGVPSGIVPFRPFGVWGDSGTGSGGVGGGNGVVGTSANYSGIAGITLSGSNDAAGIFGGGHIGVAGGTTGSNTFPNTSVGVYGTGSNNANLGGIGVQGVSDTSLGVLGESNTSDGVQGIGGSTFAGGVHGISNDIDSNGVIGDANNGGAAFGVWGRSSSGFAGYFSGNVHVNGSLTKTSGGFRIDHPLDPENKYLSHSFVESPDMLNIYNGNVTTDAHGDATVLLPDYFETLNQDFRYQLTVIGQFAQAIVSGEVSNNQFMIKTDKPNVKVSWQITGIRKDLFADMHRIQVEEDKQPHERGTYLHPEAHGKPETQSIEYASGKRLKGP